MPLTPEQQQELKELRRIDELEAKLGSRQPAQSDPGIMAGKAGRLNPQQLNMLSQGMQSALPMAGGAVGAAVGGGIPGATVGAGAGSMIKNLISGDQAPPVEAIKQVRNDAILQGMVPEMGGQAIGAVGNYLGNKAGNAADVLQQMAMGIKGKKYLPGAGTEAIQQGIRGSKEGMRSQMGSALNTEGNSLDQMVSNLKGSVDPEAIAQRVENYGKQYITPSGQSTEVGFERMQEAADRAAHIRKQGTLPPEENRSLAQIAEKSEGFSPFGTPKSNYGAKLAQQESMGRRDALRQLGTEQNIPVTEQFTKMHKLLRGNQGLNAPASLESLNPLAHPIKSTVASSPALSYGAAGVNKLADMLKNPVLKTLAEQSPRALQLMLGTPNSYSHEDR